MKFVVRFASRLGSALACAWALAAGGGCSLARAPIVAPSLDGGGPFFDVPGLDAPDAPIDAPLPDVPGLDAPDAPIDGGTDAGMADAGCLASATEACNGRDDDCDGAIDDGNACRVCITPSACMDCVGFEAGGRVYQSCPGMTGYRYWGRACASLGSRYDLAVPNDVAENDAIAAQLRAVPGVGVYHWIGVNDFETDGAYVSVGGTSIDAAPRLAATGGSHDDEAALILQPFGAGWEDWPLNATHRALCELDLAAPACTSTSDVDDTCDQVDDDCDGFWDEDCEGPASCSSKVFWDSVYYVCADDMDTDAAKAACLDLGGALAVLDHRFELEVVDDFTRADAWVGLVQDATAMEPNGWSWLGTPWMPSDPDWSAMWDTMQPTTASGEDCGFIKDTANRLQDHDCAQNRTASVCEAEL